MAELVSGSFAGTALSLSLRCRTEPPFARLVPADVICQKLQVQGPLSDTKYKGAIDCIKHVVREEGVVRGLFKGYTATVFAYLPYSCTWWTTYELSKQFLVFCTPFSSLLFPSSTQNENTTTSNFNNDNTTAYNPPLKLDDPRVHLLSGMLAGITGPMVQHPITSLQGKVKGV